MCRVLSRTDYKSRFAALILIIPYLAARAPGFTIRSYHTKMKSLLSVSDFQEKAKSVLTVQAWDYFQSHAERGCTVKENSEAFKRIQLRPRVNRDVSNLTTSTTLLGEVVDSPIGVAPTAYHKLAYHDGEISTAKGAGRKKVCYVLSSQATTSMKDVSQASIGLKWMQTFIFSNRIATKYIVEKAGSLGYKAIVLTVDTATVPYGRKPRGLKLPDNARMEVFIESGLWKGTSHLGDLPGANTLDDSVTWKDFAWLKSLTDLPIVAKGILTPEDAVLAVEHGASAVWISNHGGRQLDTVTPAIEAVEEIVRAVGDKVEVYVDGGVRYGSDVFKALALGARAVFLGRPVLWGLGVSGDDGVYRVLDYMQKSLASVMALTGCRTLKDINRSLVITNNVKSAL